MRALLPCAFLVCAPLAACAGTETGNPPFTGTLEYNAFSSQPKTFALSSDDGDGGARVTSTWLVLGDVDFVAEGDCDADVEASAHAEGLGAGDHAQPGAARTEVELSAGRYCGLRVPFLRAEAPPSNAPEALAGHSILLSGELADGVPFVLRSALDAEVLVTDAESFELDEERSTLLLGFDVATWLGGVDFTTAQTNADGSVDIDEAHNAALLEAFEAELAAGIVLHRDPSGTGEVDPDATPLARGRP